MTENKQYVINKSNIKDFLNVSQFSKKDFQKFTSRIISDMYNPEIENINVSQYRWTVSYLCSIISMEIIQCTEVLKNMHFDNFVIKKIHISKERKEILAVSDIVNDIVLDEYYNNVYDKIKPICSECVFMIATENDIDYSIMPKFDLTIEV